jgi:peptide deformylase
MEKRYQVFVSSTYNDLQEERAEVFQALMEMDCIPAGMELFPAVDEEQLEFIRRIINDCDYYLLIIGGRYGSTTPEGLSYTEKEYDYAIDRDIKVLAFVHGNPDELPRSKTDIDENLRLRLSAFRQKVQSGRLVRYWSSLAELRGQVAPSLMRTMKLYPAVGWVRANQVGSTELLSELNELRKRNQELEKLLAQINPSGAGGVPEDLAGLNESLEVQGTYSPSGRTEKVVWTHSLTWGELFALIAPELLAIRMEHSISDSMGELIVKRMRLNGRWPSMEKEIFQTIKVQFLALGLVKIENARWSLTSKGQMTMMQLRSVRSKAEP